MFHPEMKAGRKKKWIIVLTLVVLMTGVGWWHIVMNPRFHPVIDQQIYRSAQLDVPELERFTHTYGIHTILSLLGPEKGDRWYENEHTFAQQHQIRMLNIGFASHELPLKSHLNHLIDALVSEPKPLLLHCHRGSDRSGMASAIALILFQDDSLKTVERQFSWRYGVVPFTHSIGVQFFDLYEQWLKSTGQSHSRENFLNWARNDYVDPNGNIDPD